MKNFYNYLIGLLIMSSCASKEDIYYLQDAELNAVGGFVYQSSLIQPNDILKITVDSSEPLTSLPYNRGATAGASQNIQVMQLEGYLVDSKNMINFPVLGPISTLNLTIQDLAEFIKKELVERGHLTDPNVIVRLLNAKVTILGEVKAPGTYNFTEQNITLMQALGYAGDLTINGKRDDYTNY